MSLASFGLSEFSKALPDLWISVIQSLLKIPELGVPGARFPVMRLAEK
jgi:hypothetical protein